MVVPLANSKLVLDASLRVFIIFLVVLIDTVVIVKLNSPNKVNLPLNMIINNGKFQIKFQL